MYTIKNFEYTPILGWSLSRYDTFQSCKRRYFYTYYAKFDTEYSRDRILFLREMGPGQFVVSIAPSKN